MALSNISKFFRPADRIQKPLWFFLEYIYLRLSINSEDIKISVIPSSIICLEFSLFINSSHSQVESVSFFLPVGLLQLFILWAFLLSSVEASVPATPWFYIDTTLWIYQSAERISRGTCESEENQRPPAELGVWEWPLEGAGATSAGGRWFNS